MKPTRLFFQLICMLVICLQALAPVGASPTAAAAAAAAAPVPPVQTGLGGDSPLGPRGPQAMNMQNVLGDDSHFVANTGGDLDQYLFRSDRADGMLRFSIPITRFFFNVENLNPQQIAFDANGFLTAASAQYAVAKKILPANARLSMRVYDVDEEALGCPEVDMVYLNGMPLMQGGTQAHLSGADSTWSVRSFNVPVSMIKFPQNKGLSNTAPAAAFNEIQIAIDSLHCDDLSGGGWAVEVDYGELEVSAVRPVLLAHGWNGTTSTFNPVGDQLALDGIPAIRDLDLLRGIQPVADSAELLKTAARRAAKEYGVDKVNVFAHSKGGLVARWALKDDSVAPLIEHLVAYDAPNHGTLMASNDQTVRALCKAAYPNDAASAAKCYTASKELTTDSVTANFNYRGCTYSFLTGWTGCSDIYVRRPNVAYYAFTATNDTSVLPDASAGYPWNAAERPLPAALRVDAAFDSTHTLPVDIVDRPDSYQCAVHLLDSARYNCPPAPTGPAQLDDTAITATKVIFDSSGSLAAGGLYTKTFVAEAGSQLVVEMYGPAAGPAPAAALVLRTPAGDLIDPDKAAADALVDYWTDMELGVYHAVYVLDSSFVTAGSWTAQVSATGSADFGITGWTDAPLALQLSADKAIYRPGDTITVQAAVMDAGAVQKTGPITGEFEQTGGGYAPVTFYDDQTNGDVTAGDGIYTTQLTAPAVQDQLYLKADITTAAVQRKSQLLIPISSQTATITAVTGAQTPDANLDGFYDSLNMTVTVNVVKSGHFDLRGLLVDGAGNTVQAAQVLTRQTSQSPLLPGTYTMTLRFPGEGIYASGKNGPYTLTDLILQDTTALAYEVDAKKDQYTTAALPYHQFQHTLISLIEVTDTPVDANSNGKFDALAFHLKLNVEVAGGYEITGRLVDKNGAEIGWSAATFDAGIPGEQTVTLTFSGAEIGRKQAVGPYTLTDVNVANLEGTPSAFLGTVYTTGPYTFAQFEGGFYRAYMPNMMNNASPDGTYKPVLKGPINNGVVSTLIPGFSWVVPRQAVKSTICFAIAASPNPTTCSLEYKDAEYGGTYDNVVLPFNLQPNTVYYWRVGIIIDGQSTAARWSDEWHLSSSAGSGAILPAPTLTYPRNGSTQPYGSINLSWTLVTGSAGYVLTIHDTTHETWVVRTVPGNSVGLPASLFMRSTNYEWSVQAKNEYAWGTPSAVWKFTTGQ